MGNRRNETVDDDNKCCVCGAEATCSTGGDRYCDSHCPDAQHDN